METENGFKDSTKQYSERKQAWLDRTAANREKFVAEATKQPNAKATPRPEGADTSGKRVSVLFRKLFRRIGTTQDIVAEQLGISKPTLNASITSESMSMRRFLDIMDMLNVEVVLKRRDDYTDIVETIYGEDPCETCRYKKFYERINNAQASFEAEGLEELRAEERERAKAKLMK